MRSMQEIKQAREDLDREMVAASQNEGEAVKKRIEEFLARMKDEYGFYDIQYEIVCLWEDEDAEDRIGLDQISICNL